MTCDALKSFGSAARPLRASQLPALLQCPWSVVMKFLESCDTSGEAADTGSAVHRAIAAAHTSADDPYAVMQECRAEYPLADFQEAGRHVAAYLRDARNTTPGVVRYAEQEVQLTIPAKSRHAAVRIQGTLDQIRFDGSRYTVWDVKTGRRDGVEQLYFHAPQLAAYVLAARDTLKIDVHPGGIIRTQGYLARSATAPSPDGVFFFAPWTVDDCEEILRQVAEVVYAVRAGKVRLTPGGHCRYCPACSPSTCIPLHLEKLRNGKKESR